MIDEINGRVAKQIAAAESKDNEKMHRKRGSSDVMVLTVDDNSRGHESNSKWKCREKSISTTLK